MILDDVADHPQEFGPDKVAVVVVDLLEVVEVNENNGEFVFVAGGTVDFRIEDKVEVAGVVKRRAVVRNRQFVNPLDVAGIFERDGRVVG